MGSCHCLDPADLVWLIPAALTAVAVIAAALYFGIRRWM